ncbi:hypothetical protein, partial [Escherichia coli]|uniref:hypothetical protein n=1 Tax=Escherichia coli TaxID=562 RepID=UPI001F1C569A
KILADSALRDLSEIKNDSTLADYELAGTVAYNSPRVVSVYFDGYNNYKEAAHPNQFLYTVTVDLQSMKPVALKDLVRIDESFVGKLL